jgi:hypothetical protein
MVSLSNHEALKQGFPEQILIKRVLFCGNPETSFLGDLGVLGG